jgi:uncharacterized protein (UPF0332 family)
MDPEETKKEIEKINQLLNAIFQLFSEKKFSPSIRQAYISLLMGAQILEKTHNISDSQKEEVTPLINLLINDYVDIVNQKMDKNG